MPKIKETSDDILQRTGNILTALEMQIDGLKAEILAFGEEEDSFTIEEELENLQDLRSKYQRQLSEYLTYASTELVAARTEHTARFETAVKRMTIHLKRLRSKKPVATPEKKVEAVVKLQDMPLPTFNGDCCEWVNYKIQMLALLINNKTLVDIQKLQYLKSSLVGKAKGIQSPQDTCESLWQALVERYEIKRNIVENHIKALFHLKVLKKESSIELRELLATVTKHVRALNSLELEQNDLSQQMLINLVCSRLDPETRKAYEGTLVPQDLPDYEVMMKFLDQRCHTLESIESYKSAPPIEDTKPAAAAGYSGGAKPKGPFKKLNSFVAGSSPETPPRAQQQPKQKCPLCGEAHNLTRCREFIGLCPSDRLNKVKSLKLCVNCLRTTHPIAQCKSLFCRQCGGQHHSMLHLSFGQPQPSSVLTVTSGSPSKNFLVASKRILLATVQLIIEGKYGQQYYCRAVLDSASESNFITEDLVQNIGAKKRPVQANVIGITQEDTAMNSVVRATIRSRTSGYKETLDFLVLSRFRSNFPSVNINTKGWKIPPNIIMADPHFDLSEKVDMLLGAEIFFDIWTNRSLALEKGQPPLRETCFGWIVGGKTSDFAGTNSFVSSNFCANVTYTNADLMNEIRKFWEIESCQLPSSLMSPEERQVEQHFQSTHRRQTDGRYIVCLPTKPSVDQLGDSKTMALKRFGLLERRFEKNPELKIEYTKFIHEYQQLGHMRPTDAAGTAAAHDIEYFLPHHAVLKPSSSTTKLRVVFDASAVTTTGLSLNNVLQVGPTIQQELFEILIRFRKYPYAITADIGKMYRQVLVDEKQHRLQQILWRDEKSEEIKAYSLQTVTYGTASAPYLATRALQQLAEDEAADFPLASIVASRDFYVDDVLTGAETVSEALTLQKELIELCKRGGFSLHKWCSNRQELLDSIPSDLCEHKVRLSDNQTVKTLGLTWLPHSDNFVIAIENTDAREVTKRTILSDIAKLFDPLGLTGPVIVTAKMILQKLWQKHTDWDAELDEEDRDDWLNYRGQLQELRKMSVPRCILSMGPLKSVKLVGFCDGSTQAYGACIYVLCTSFNDQSTARLLCSKSRVAPLKTITVPRLELCSAVLLSQLVTKAKNAINLPFEKIVLFSDSTVVLGWINSQSNKMKTFVAHRVAEIQTATNVSDWRHVPTAENPADIISRGLMPNQLQDSALWWSGPLFLQQPETHWPSNPAFQVAELPEMKSTVAMVVSRAVTCDALPVLTKFSSWAKLQRVIAYVQRFISNCRTRSGRSQKYLTVPEMISAQRCIIRIVQTEAFGAEIKAIESGKPLDRKSPLFRLNVFVDSDKIIRVGGRLKQSNQAFDTKHQIVLPRRCHVTTVLIRELHEEHGHVGPQALLSIVRQTYWPIGAKDITKNVTRKCVRCFRYRPRTTEQFMGDLPGYRTNICHPFVNTGVDYAGPMTLKLTRRTSTKAYVAIFVCMSTKAVHIELVSDLSTKAFLAALDRFMARRGYCANIYCDNGTNFVGAHNELNALYEFLRDERTAEDIANSWSPRQVAFHFIPPRAPHFGGLWEAAVKSAKYHLIRIVGRTALTFEEMSTVLTKIEAILNSRPLFAEPNDPEDVNAITPGHFLIGRPLVAMLEPNFVDVNENRLRRWQLLQKVTQHFWKRWSLDYLSTLQKRTKADRTITITVDMVVLIKEDNLPPTQWLMGRVVEVHPGRDGLVRVVKLKTRNGTCTRAVVKLCILPINDGED